MQLPYSNTEIRKTAPVLINSEKFSITVNRKIFNPNRNMSLKTSNINKKTMGKRWENGGKEIEFEYDFTGDEVKGVSKITLNAIESAMLKFARTNRKFLTVNVYHWFAVKLGYKKKNTVYEWFYSNDINPKYANNAKIGLRDLKRIYQITKDEEILEAFIEECRRMN